MNRWQAAADRAQAMPSVSFSPIRAGVVQRQCAGGAARCGTCEDCRQPPSLQRQAVERSPSSVPAIAQQVLQSPGQPLDRATRAVMESRFGHDFSRVRVHTDATAAAAAQSVRAIAYTVHRHIVFARGHYAPATAQGRQLLAHELTHVVQQGGDRSASFSGAVQFGSANLLQEQEADRISRTVTAMPSPYALAPQPANAVALQRQPNPTVQLNLQIDDRGKVEVTIAGPELPVVGNPTLGIRRNPDSSYDVLVGGKGKTVAASQIPQLFKGMLGSSKPGTQPSQPFRVPTCAQLRAASGTGYMTFAEYRISQMLSPNLLPMTPALYEALVETCRPKPIEVPAMPPPPLQDAPLRRLPEGMEMA